MASVATVTVAQSAQVSGTFGLGNTGRLSVWCPVVTSCALRLLASHDTTSANFVPVHDSTSAAARTTFYIAAGSRMVQVGDVTFAYAKLDLDAPQAAARTFNIITRP
jgi:hypothetical protein